MREKLKPGSTGPGEKQLDFLDQMASPEDIEAARKQQAALAKANALAEKPTGKKAQPHKIRPESGPRLGWASHYYGNDPDDPKQ